MEDKCIICENYINRNTSKAGIKLRRGPYAVTCSKNCSKIYNRIYTRFKQMYRKYNEKQII